MIVIPTPSVASPAAMELGQKLVNVIEEFRAARPGTSGTDIRQALRIASLHAAPMQRTLRFVLMLVAVLVAGALALLAALR